jgi:hypothetical protein
MNTNLLTPGERQDLWSRLHTMTAGVAMAGIAATVGIGAVAAMHHPGKATAANAAAGSAGTREPALVPRITAAPGANDGQSADPNAPVQPLPALGAPAATAPPDANPPVVKPRVRVKAHVSSGGS